ncbi:hypothetical protein AAE303_005605 [Salmonella enterica]|nr:hypothetical protein [Salmonella enterica subsp. diarizonae]
MNKLWLIMLGIGVICALIIILLDVINEFLHGTTANHRCTLPSQHTGHAPPLLNLASFLLTQTCCRREK